MPAFFLPIWHKFYQRWRNTSFRRRLVVGVTLLHVLLMGVLVTTLLLRQHQFLHEQGLGHARSLVQTLAVSSSSWVMAHDVAGLQEVVQSAARHEHVRYVMVLAPDGQVLAHSTPQFVGQYIHDASSTRLLQESPGTVLLVANGDVVDIAAPIMAPQQLLAWARVGMEQDYIRANLVELTQFSLVYIALGVLVAYIFATLTAKQLVRGLRYLMVGFERVRKGKRGFRLSHLHNDEVGQLGQNFNALLQALEANEAQLRALATTDFLTGLANRRSFMESMQAELARIQRNPQQLACVLMLDLDRFKRVNDTYGHAAGDQVLRHTAQLMLDNQRKIDLCGRLGGEEFSILLPGENIATACVFAERIRSLIETTPARLQDGNSIAITISIGVAALLPSDTSPEQSLIRADNALYRAKANGRNRVEVQEQEQEK